MAPIRDASLVHSAAGSPSFVSIGPDEIAYWEIGGGPPVICLHGFPDHPLGILPFAEALAAAGFRCICPALPGYWPSSPLSGGDYGVPALSELVLGLIDRLGLSDPVLVGHDWGAVIGYRIGSRHPDRIAHLVALAVPHPACFAVRRSEFAELRTAWYAIFLAYASGAAAVARDSRWLTALVQSWSPGFFWADWPRVLDQLQRPGVMEAICAYYRADMEADVDPEPVAVPTTIVHGGQDGCIRPTVFADQDRWFTGRVRTELMPRVGHWPHLEDMRSTARLVTAELGGDSRPSPVP